MLDFDVALDVVSDFRKVTFHALGILVVDDFQELFQLRTNLRHLVVGIGVEQNFLQQIIVLVEHEHTFGNAHVALEGSTWRILMFHDSSEDKGAHKWNGQRVSHCLIVLLKGVLVNVQPQLLIEVLEEDATHIVALADDDGVLFGKLL